MCCLVTLLQALSGSGRARGTSDSYHPLKVSPLPVAAPSRGLPCPFHVLYVLRHFVIDMHMETLLLVSSYLDPICLRPPNTRMSIQARAKCLCPFLLLSRLGSPQLTSLPLPLFPSRLGLPSLISPYYPHGWATVTELD